MKKILVVLISFLYFTDAHAQWEKVLGKNNVPNQATAVSRYGSNAFVCGFGGIHYSRDEGQNWKVLRPDYFKVTDLVVSTNCVANEYGIFAFLVKSASNIDFNFLAFTPNFGRTWEIKPLAIVGGTTSGSYQPCLLGQSKDYLHARPASLAVIEKANVPKEKILVVITRNTPYITLDSGKTWVAFNLGIENETALKLQQVDGFLFVTTDKGLYRRSLEDINLRSITGTVFLDTNGNNTQDAQENGVLNAKIYSKLNGAFTYSDSSGRYNLLADVIGIDTIAASFDNRYATITPKSYAVSQSDTGKNFAIKLAPNVNDVKGNLTAITPPRPGFNTTYLVNYKNIGSTSVNGKVSLKYDAKLSFIEANAIPSTNANQLATWNYTNLQPNESRSLNVTFKTVVSATIGSLVTNILTIDPLSIRR
jgi:hypothetical protein